MAPIDFYYVPHSLMCNAIIMVAKAIDVKLNFILTQTKNGDHMKPAFLKINPQHSIPTIDDNGFALWETRPILTYLIEKYAADDALYPRDPQRRAVVNQRLYFDMGTLNKAFGDYFFPMMRKQPVDPEQYKGIETAFEYLDGFLEGHPFVAGDFLSVADFMCGSTVAMFKVLDCDVDKYPNVKRWFASLDEHLPAFDVAKKNMEGFKSFLV